MSEKATREGSLEAPIRHPVDWQSPEFYDEQALFGELERVFDICHGCRRCFNLCNAFPTLFDAVDESESGELDSVPKQVFWDVVDHCYLCDMCYMSKCPYVPPHEWNVDFPHLMLRAKAKRFKDQGAPLRDRVLASTDQVGRLAGIPVVADVVNAVTASGAGRVVMEKTLGVDRSAPVPQYHARSARKRIENAAPKSEQPIAANGTSGRVILFTTCYGDRNAPQICESLVSVFRHNDIQLQLTKTERCCGMPRLELGDLDAVARARDSNIPDLYQWVKEGWDIVASVPSCVLMFKQELPLLFPDDEEVKAVAAAMYDPFEYLMLRYKGGELKTDFKGSLGKVVYQVPCHLRVQNIGLKTKMALELVPDTEVETIERCSGHDGTYGVKQRFREASRKIARPVVSRVKQAQADHFVSDCPMAGEQIAIELASTEARHPMDLLKMAYGL